MLIKYILNEHITFIPFVICNKIMTQSKKYFDLESISSTHNDNARNGSYKNLPYDYLNYFVEITFSI